VRVAVRIPLGVPMEEALGAIELAERAGFDTVSVPESPTLFRDTFVALGLAATRTTTATLACTVTSFVSHDPINIANSARTLAELAPGRIRIGIGAGDSSSFLTGRPTTTTRELREGFEIVSGLLAGEVVTVRGTGVHLQDPCGPLPIFLAADGPKNLALAAEIADGVITWSGDLERKAAQLAEAKRAYDRTRELHHVVTTTACVTTDVARDAWFLKPYIVRFAQRIGPAQLDELGFGTKLPDDNVLLTDGVDLGHPRDLAAAAEFASRWISDDFAVWYATNVCCFGTPGEVAAKLSALADYGADEVQVTDGSSFSTPIRLINQMAAEVIPSLHRARRQCPQPRPISLLTGLFG
jgi:5,10-methylenetetrahydromethanopterin reductase